MHKAQEHREQRRRFCAACSGPHARSIAGIAAASLLLSYPYLMRISPLLLAPALPPTPPSSGNALWYRQPATAWSKDYLPVGNGFLGAMLSGGTDLDQTQLNIESLWSGGPFENASYNGGNHPVSEAPFLAAQTEDIRARIFGTQNGMVGNIDVLTEPFPNYGSYTAAPWLFTALTAAGHVSNYTRWLDLDSSTAHTTWSTPNSSFARETFCAFPSRACVQYTAASTSASLSLSYYFAPVPGVPTPQVTCLDRTTLRVRGTASTPGMAYELLARVQTSPEDRALCTTSSSTNASISVAHADSAWITWVGGTEYARDAPGFTFRGPDPHAATLALLNTATAQSYAAHRDAHTHDYTAGTGTFALTLGAPEVSRPTDELLAAYETGKGNPFLEGLLFNYARYLLYSSARGVLPANLQGVWGRDSAQPWGADYHANINVQMNYWAAEPTGLDVTQPLWDYMEQTWAPRGAETARVLYNISRGWVTHNEMNIFGHTGMKGGASSASWSDYPESAVWMMMHVWDHFDYTNDVAWWRAQGWPLLKGVASFHLDRLIPDLHTRDGTLVVAPCNSPEQNQITFGCAHQQQILWQMFNAVEKGFDAAGDGDTAFLQEVLDKRAHMDAGLRVGSWGQLQEWKLDMDQLNDTHREIAHLVGVYPGAALASYAGQTNYSKEELLAAAQVSLVHRGNGTGPDADAGWEKMWRAAAWAQFGDADRFYEQLTYGIRRNFGPNLFSLYDPETADPIFQIDANLAYPGAVLNALVQAPDVASQHTPLVITLLPALPPAWHTGHLAGLRMRGGMSLDLQWKDARAASGVIHVDAGAQGRNVSVVYEGNEVDSFVSAGGMARQLRF